MEKKIIKSNFIFVSLLTVVMMIFGIYLWISSKDMVFFSYDNPILTDSPIYEELSEGDSKIISLTSDRDEKISGITILPVNVNPSGEGSINIRIEGADNTVKFTKISEKNIKVGEWNKIPVTTYLSKDKPVKVTLTAVNCNPYFMYAPAAGNEPDGISVGKYTDSINRNMFTALMVKYAIVLLIYILLLAVRFGSNISLLNKCGNDMFLLLVYIFICIGIYSASYKNGVFITADSAGYLREAVNLKAGYGFGYDALAGYKSWFANWPILYPFMIVIVMFLSGIDAYISSKILSAVLVLAILVVLRFRFKKDAWKYSLALMNLGFVNLTYYTWSEIPFILFLLSFALKLGDIVSEGSEREEKISDYVLLGVYGFLSFLTRYFGIYVWVVVGGYIALYLIKRMKTKEKTYFIKALKLTITAMISGLLSLGYLFMNKVMNGMPSGVSRSTWWDDYRTLTVDLFNSLITEFFNVFHIDCSEILGRFGFIVKVIIVLVILGLMIFAVIKGLKDKGGLYSADGAFLVLGASYYAIFTVIRYFSSMDTFYFRFFEPASFLLTMGIIMLIIRYIKPDNRLIHIFGLIISLLIAIGIVDYATTGLCMSPNNYYDVVKSEWDKAYAEIPTGSVAIFSDLDFRSEYYRPDVVSGEISSVDTWEDVSTRYYGSKHLIIQREYAESMVECGEYDISVSDMLASTLKDKSNSKYICIELRGN